MTKQTSTTEAVKTKRRLEGVVVKKSGIKTVAVEVIWESRHPMYGKVIKHTKKYLAHDPLDTTEVGARVVIEEARPLSRKKRFVIVKKATK